jgi:hypothetical protein
MPFIAGQTILPGELFVPATLHEARERALRENRPIMIRRSTDGGYALLVQTENEIDPVEEMRLRPVLYATVFPAYGRAHVIYEDGRAELI